MTSPIVEVIAEALYLAEGKTLLGPRPRWARLSEHTRHGLRERVASVLLAAGDVGYVLTRSPMLEPPGRHTEPELDTDPTELTPIGR